MAYQKLSPEERERRKAFVRSHPPARDYQDALTVERLEKELGRRPTFAEMMDEGIREVLSGE